MSTTHRRLFGLSRRRRNERGVLTFEAIVGMALAGALTAGLAAVYVTSNQHSVDAVDRTQQESDGVQTLNRMVRAIEASARVLKAAPSELVVERPVAAGAQKTRTYYRVEGTGSAMAVVSREETVAAGAGFDPAAPWTATATLARRVTSSTRFDYADRSGSTTSNASDVGRVDITFEAVAAKGKVTLKTSAAVRSTKSGAPTIISGPTANPDTVTVTKGSSAVVDVTANDRCNGSSSACAAPFTVVANGTGGVTAASAGPDNGNVTVTVPAGYSGATGAGAQTLTYTLTDSTGAALKATGSISVTILNPATTPVPANDTINVVRGGAAVTFDLFANDSSLDTPTKTVAAVPAGLTVTNGANGSVTVTAGAGFAGGTFTYEVTNAGGAKATATVTVLGIDAVDDAASLAAGTSTTVNLYGNDLKTASTTISVKATSLPAGVTASLNAATGDLTVTAGAASSGSGTVTYTLTQPQAGASSPTVTDDAVVTVTVLASAPLSLSAFPVAAPASRSATQGANRVTWIGGVAPYTVEASTDGGTTWSTIASGVAGTSIADQTVNLGTSTLYRVTDASGAKTSNTARQFPAMAVPMVQGSDSDNDKIADAPGSNRITWTSAAGASVYDLRVYRSDLNSMTLNVALTQQATISAASTTTGRCSGLSRCYVETGQAPGTERVYDVVAYGVCDDDIVNGTAGAPAPSRGSGGTAECGSGNVAAGAPDYATSARAYQAPSLAVSATAGAADADACFEGGTGSKAGASTGTTRSVSTVPTASDSNGYYHCGTGTARLSFVADPDHGMPATSQFCDYPDNLGVSVCFAMKQAKAGAAPSQAEVAAGQVSTFTQSGQPLTQTDWGVTDYWAIVACNPGGCAPAPNAAGTLKVHAYPAPLTVTNFYMGDSDSGVERRSDYNTTWYSPGCFNATGCTGDRSEPTAYWSWSNSVNSDRYATAATRIAGHGVGSRNLPETSTGLTRNSGWNTVYDATSYEVRTWAYVDAAADHPQRWRDIRKVARTSPPPLAFAQDSPFCAAAYKTSWKYAVAFRTQVLSKSGADASADVSGVRWMLWASKVDIGTEAGTTQVGLKAAQDWMKSTGTSEPDGTTWPAPASWTKATRVWEYGSAAASASLTPRKQMLGGVNNVAKMIPWDNSGTTIAAAHFRAEAYTTLADAGNPDFADLTSWGRADEYTSAIGSKATRAAANNVTDPATCNTTAGNRYDTGYAWYANGNGNQVSRKVHPTLTNAHESPATQLWAQTPNYP